MKRICFLNLQLLVVQLTVNFVNKQHRIIKFLNPLSGKWETRALL